VPDSAIALALLKELGEPMLNSSLILPNQDVPLTDPYDIGATLEYSLDLIIDGGYCGMEVTSLVSLVDGEVEVLRQGMGDTGAFE
jgi:tRNA A37 threonylcarbamoyladenosine synthetase subunit TsaC/SUA5/YrdC